MTNIDDINATLWACQNFKGQDKKCDFFLHQLGGITRLEHKKMIFYEVYYVIKI